MTKKSHEPEPTSGSRETPENCPCRKHGCSRRLNCAACRRYHYEKNGLPKCER